MLHTWSDSNGVVARSWSLGEPPLLHTHTLESHREALKTTLELGYAMLA